MNFESRIDIFLHDYNNGCCCCKRKIFLEVSKKLLWTMEKIAKLSAFMERARRVTDFVVCVCWSIRTGNLVCFNTVVDQQCWVTHFFFSKKLYILYFFILGWWSLCFMISWYSSCGNKYSSYFGWLPCLLQWSILTSRYL